VQWVFPSAGVALHAIWVRSNAPPSNGEERLNTWDPLLEALPVGCEPCDAIQNPRSGPWPDMFDDFPFILADTSVPPWMQSTKFCEVDLRPAHGASTGRACTWDNTQGQPLPIGDDHEDCWSAWPRIRPSVGLTEGAPEVWANEWTSESAAGASWDGDVEVPACTEPPRVQLLPGPKQLRPRGSVALLQQRRVEQHQKDQKKEDRELRPDDAAATAAMLRHWSSIRPGCRGPRVGVQEEGGDGAWRWRSKEVSLQSTRLRLFGGSQCQRFRGPSCETLCQPFRRGDSGEAQGFCRPI